MEQTSKIRSQVALQYADDIVLLARAPSAKLMNSLEPPRALRLEARNLKESGRCGLTTTNCMRLRPV